MDAPINVPDTALPQGSLGVPPNAGFSQVNAEAPPEEGALRYECFQCHTSYTQRQGLGRHNRTVHNPSLCLLCEFRWGRPYEYRVHLQKNHPDVDPDVILGKPAGSRRRAAILTERLPQEPPVLPPAVEQDQNWAESQPSPWAPPSPAGARDTSVSPLAVSYMGYNSQAIYVEQTVTMDEREYSHGSEFLNGAYILAMIPSTNERAEPVNDSDISLQDTDQFGLPSAQQGGSTATHSPKTAPFPTLFPPSEQYDALVSGEDPIVVSFGPMHYSPLSDTDIDAIFDSIFTNSTF